MERRTGFAVAGAVAMILVAGAIAAGANLGLLRSGSASKVGHLKPADATAATAGSAPQVVTVEVQDPGHAATASVVPSTDGSQQAVRVQTIPTVHAGSASGEQEHGVASSSGASADD